MRICLHIGAHKTATTYVQSRLFEKRHLLEPRGVSIVSAAQYRRAVADRMDLVDWLGRGGLAIAHRAIAQGFAKMIDASPGLERLIMSDENLAGPLASVTSPSGLYPSVDRRVGAALSALKGHDVTVFLAIRAYPGFFDSVYAYRTGQQKAADPEVFRGRVLALRRGWREVVGDICREAGPDRTVVWTYEDFQRRPDAVAEALTGVAGLDLLSAADRPRLPSVTRRGMAVLDAAAPFLSADEYVRFARAVARFRFEQPDGKFELLEPASADRLRARYAEDVDAIAALGCTIVGRTHGAAPRGAAAPLEAVD